MNNKVIYTSLTNHYDKLPQYDIIDPSFDYICFTNDYPEGTKIGQWLILPIPFEHKNPIHMSRYAKILPHKVLTQYEWSVWLDANVIIKSSKIYDCINTCINRNQLWSGLQHPRFDCIYQDINECIRNGRIKYYEGRRQLNLLEQAGYPRHNGLFENNVIIRKHNESSIIDISTLWWEYFVNYVPRDQFSLFFVFWKYNFRPSLILEPHQNTRNMESIKWIFHNKKSIYKRIIRKLRILGNKLKLNY